MKTERILLVICGLLMYIASCTTDQAFEPVPGNIDSCVQVGDTVTYVGYVKEILETHCTDPQFGSCHQPETDGGTFGLDFTTYSGIKIPAGNGKLADRVLGPFATGEKMPKAGPVPNDLSACDTSIIRIWIENGFPEN